MTDLEHLAILLREHHRITVQIAALIGRSAERGHIGAFIASQRPAPAARGGGWDDCQYEPNGHGTRNYLSPLAYD